MLLASAPPVGAFPGAPGCHCGSPQDSSCTGGVTVAEPESWGAKEMLGQSQQSQGQEEGAPGT